MVTWCGRPSNPRPPLTAADPQPSSVLFAALGNPARLGIVQHILEHGPSERSVLQDLIDTNSSGQLYHHLNALIDAGIVELYKRGVYAISTPNVVRLLALLGVAF